MFWSSQGRKYSIYGRFCSTTLNKLKSELCYKLQQMYGSCIAVSNYWVQSARQITTANACMRFSYLLELYGLSACGSIIKLTASLSLILFNFCSNSVELDQRLSCKFQYLNVLVDTLGIGCRKILYQVWNRVRIWGLGGYMYAHPKRSQ